jgi:hypothetical protein
LQAVDYKIALLQAVDLKNPVCLYYYGQDKTGEGQDKTTPRKDKTKTTRVMVRRIRVRVRVC